MTHETFSSVDRVRNALAAAGLPPRVEEFPASTRTAEEAAAAIGTSASQIVKSLVFLSGESPVLVLMSGGNRLDTDRLAALTGAMIRKADAQTVRAATGYAIGGVPPIGFPASLPTFIDRDLMKYETVWAAAGTPRHVFPASPADLVRVTSGTVAELKPASQG